MIEDHSEWYVANPDGTTTWIPQCSPDYIPTTLLYQICLQDPDTPVCHRHKQFLTGDRLAESF